MPPVLSQSKPQRSRRLEETPHVAELLMQSKRVLRSVIIDFISLHALFWSLDDVTTEGVKVKPF